jgi:hypothetical protein
LDASGYAGHQHYHNGVDQNNGSVSGRLFDEPKFHLHGSLFDLRRLVGLCFDSRLYQKQKKQIQVGLIEHYIKKVYFNE